MNTTQVQSSEISSHGVVIAAELHKELHSASHASLLRGGIFVVLYAVCGWLIMQWQGIQDGGPWIALACLPLYLVAAASLHGISLFTHEAVHGVLSDNRAVNRALGIACALPVLQNFSAYKVLHLRHHKHLGHEGDPDHYDNYTQWTWLVFTMHWVRLIIGYPIYIVMIPILGFRQGNASDKRWILFESLLLLGLVAAAVVTVPATILLHVWLIPMLIINTLVNIRGMSQHTFLEEPDDPVQGTRSILTNPITEFFMCNENYHLEHHLFPRVPWYNLKRLHGAVREQLTDRHAPFVQSYLQFVCEFAAKSWGRSPWGRSRQRD
jgi:fatty acid desaturase